MHINTCVQMQMQTNPIFTYYLKKCKYTSEVNLQMPLKYFENVAETS